MVDAFFRREAEQFVPADIARGPWDRESLHGRVLAGLIAHSVEREYGDDEFQYARLTVDMFRLAPFAPLTVSTRVVRQGGRIRVIEGTIAAAGVDVARGSVVMLRRTDEPEGHVWSPPPWQVPPPEQLSPPQIEGEPRLPPMWETRNIDGAMGSVEQKRAWIRELRPLVDAEPLTPFTRVAVACDFANPFANSGDHGLNHVNADVSLYLHRLPVDEWIGFEVTSHHSAEGVAVGECALYDTTGAIGRSLVCAVAQRRRTG